MQSRPWPILHSVLFCALLPVLFHSAKTLAAEPMQQVQPVSSELFCDWLKQKPGLAEKAPANVKGERKLRIGLIHIRTEPIFAADADAIWLHHFANLAHVTTRPDTVAHELPFASGEQLQLSDLAEAERLLRDKSYCMTPK